MYEMLILIGKLGVTQIQAANAVKIKCDLKVSVKTLCNEYRKFIKDREEALLHMDFTMTEIAKTKFITSYPVAARKYLRKKRPVKR